MTEMELVKLDPKDYQVEGGLTVKELWGPQIEPVKRPCACGKPMGSQKKMCDECWHKRRLLRTAERVAKRAEGGIIPIASKSAQILHREGPYAAL